jgi:hypothetical protein
MRTGASCWPSGAGVNPAGCLFDSYIRVHCNQKPLIGPGGKVAVNSVGVVSYRLATSATMASTSPVRQTAFHAR